MAVNDPPGATEVGTPVTLNELPVRLLVTVSGLVPPLVMVTGSGSVLPIGTVPNASDVGEAYKPGFVPSPDRPMLTVGNSARSVANDRLPVAPPGLARLNVTGTVTLSPGVSVTGSAGGD